MSEIGISELSPFIFTGNPAAAVGGYHASNDRTTPEEHIINVKDMPPGARIIEAWYTPYHNIRELHQFDFIDVRRHNDTQVILSIAGYGDSHARLRIRITVLYKY